MPKENRSSSNHGTRTFTLDSLTDALEQVQALHEISADLIAENVFGQPAQQGEGEPMWYEHAMRDEKGRPFQFQVTRSREPAFGRPNVDYDSAYSVTVDPLYKHADHDEVERLREVEDAYKALEGMVELAAKAVGDNTGLMWLKVQTAFLRDLPQLRAQLAEAHALLARILGKRDPCPARYWFEEIEKVLSASAEPAQEANAGEVERLRADYEHAFNSGEAARGECDVLRAQLAEAHALLREVQPCISTWTNGKKSALRAKVDAALSASAEPSAPECLTCKGSGLDYDNGTAIPCIDCWEVFQVRAALSDKGGN